jgi:hypothetical protein
MAGACGGTGANAVDPNLLRQRLPLIRLCAHQLYDIHI